MRDSEKTKAQLIEELEVLRAQIAGAEQKNRLDNPCDEMPGGRDPRSPEQDNRESDGVGDPLLSHLRFLETLIDTIPSPIYHKDVAGVYQGCNKAFAEKIIGLPREQIVGRSMFDLSNVIPRDLAEIYHERDMQLIRDSGTQVYEWQVRCADGKRRDFAFYKATYQNAKGELGGIVGMMIDITERNRAEKALRESERLYREAIRVAEAVPYFRDYRTEEYEFFSSEIERMIGYRMEEISPQLLTEITLEWVLLGPLEGLSLEEAVQRAISEEGISWRADYRVRAQTGEERWLSDAAVQVRDDKGEVHGTLGILRDITEQKRAEKALRESEHLYREAIRVADAVPYFRNYRLDRYEYFGSEIDDMIGYRAEEITPDLLGEITLETVLLGPLEGLGSDEAMQRSRSSEGVSWRADYRIRTRSGEERWLADAAVQVRDDRGEVYGALGILQDITERKRLEEQLLQSQKMEAIGRLAGGIAHDFNNLLMPIIGYSELMLDLFGENHPLRKEVQEIKKAGARAASLTKQLLAFGRKQVLQPTNLDLNTLVLNTEKLLHRLIGENIRLEIRPDPDLGQVYADPGQIEQVIVNLAVNARDAMPSGGRFLIETGNVDLDLDQAQEHIGVSPGPYVMLTVSDTGCGMSADVREHLFEPFFTTKEVGKGSGLGLPTVQGIVEQSGGFIEVESEPGQGTTFRVYLPRVPAKPELPTEEREPARPLSGSETVLLVEDEQVVRDTVSLILRKYGYTVLDVGNAEEALRMCESHKGEIDLVLSDVVMPGISGQNLGQMLAREHPTVKVLLMSGYPGSELTARGILKEEILLLQKPFDARSLLSAVRRTLDGK